MSVENNWQLEAINFSKMSSIEKIRWLCRLMFFVSMLAREFYDIENTGTLKKSNELLHRISSHLLKHINNDSERMSDSQFFEALEMMVNEAGFKQEILFKML